jgi:SAM-dependent methyltransferase
MTEQQDDQARHDTWIEIGVRTDIPHPARVYNYLLGGKDHFRPDREAAEMSLRVMPEVRDSAQGNRQFLARAVAFLRDAGIVQFLDIGTGLPASPNTHEIAGEGAKVAYVDNDPVVFMRASAVLADDKSAVSIPADMRDTGEVLSEAGKLLDFTQPAGLMFNASLHNIPDEDDPAGIVQQYLAALAPGSYLAISHATGDFAPKKMAQVTVSYAERGAVFIGRTRAQVTAMFCGRPLVDPGVVQISHWRPKGGTLPPNADRVWGYAGIAAV